MPSKLLSKSRYLNGLQCPKLLWVFFHEPEQLSVPDSTTQYLFDQGHLVGEIARKIFPEGLMVPFENFMGNITMTKIYLKQKKPLFEAGILAGKLYSRVD